MTILIFKKNSELLFRSDEEEGRLNRKKPTFNVFFFLKKGVIYFCLPKPIFLVWIIGIFLFILEKKYFVL